MKFKDLLNKKDIQDERIEIEEPSQSIEIEINSGVWNETAKNLKGDNSSEFNFLLFKKLGFEDGDKIQIFSTEVSEEISEKVTQWINVDNAMPKRFFKIVSEKRGEFILGNCYCSVVLLNEDLTEEKKYDFTFSKLDNTRLNSERNTISNSNIRLEILYDKSSHQFFITCREIKDNKKLLKFSFSLSNDFFEPFDEAEITQAKINRVKEETSEIRRRLLELKEIPNHETIDKQKSTSAIIKLFKEITLNDYFTEIIELEEITLTNGDREDNVKFKNGEVVSCQIQDFVNETIKSASKGNSMISDKRCEINTSEQSTKITLSEISKEMWLEGCNQVSLDFITSYMREQKFMEKLLTEINDSATRSLKLSIDFN